MVRGKLAEPMKPVQPAEPAQRVVPSFKFPPPLKEWLTQNIELIRQVGQQAQGEVRNPNDNVGPLTPVLDETEWELYVSGKPISKKTCSADLAVWYAHHHPGGGNERHQDILTDLEAPTVKLPVA